MFDEADEALPGEIGLLLARALVCTVLSRYKNVEPERLHESLS